MWLPKDERRLLAGYYRSIRAVGTERQYTMEDLARFLGCRVGSEGWAEKSPTREAMEREIEGAVDVLRRSENANKLLSARSLITCTPQQPGTCVNVSLTVDGYDLGRRYSHCFFRSGLWLNEYGNHWAVAFFVGVVGTKLVEWMWSFLTNT